MLSKDSSKKSSKISDRLDLGEKAAHLLIELAGEDGAREGLKETPRRVAKAYQQIFSGYEKTAKIEAGQGVFHAEGPGLVSVNQVEFYSVCEHHMLPFWGKCSVGYYPKKKILGLSKIPRIIDVYARRMQVQERLTREICDAIVELIDPRAVYVRMTGQHMCMMMRGVEKECSFTVTESFFGTDSLTDIEKQQLLTVPTIVRDKEDSSQPSR